VSFVNYLTSHRNLIFPLSSSCLQGQVKPVLDKLIGDNDVDVKFFAGEAISGIPG
jgi:hypothetical protein